MYLFLETGGEGEREREKERERNTNVVASRTPPTGDLASNPDMCPALGIKLGTLWFSGWHSIH